MRSRGGGGEEDWLRIRPALPILSGPFVNEQGVLACTASSATLRCADLSFLIYEMGQ